MLYNMKMKSIASVLRIFKKTTTMYCTWSFTSVFFFENWTSFNEYTDCNLWPMFKVLVSNCRGGVQLQLFVKSLTLCSRILLVLNLKAPFNSMELYVNRPGYFMYALYKYIWYIYLIWIQKTSFVVSAIVDHVALTLSTVNSDYTIRGNSLLSLSQSEVSQLPAFPGPIWGGWVSLPYNVTWPDSIWSF